MKNEHHVVENEEMNAISTARYEFAFIANVDEDFATTVKVFDKKTRKEIISVQDGDILIHRYDSEGRLTEKSSLDGLRTIKYFYVNGKIKKIVDIRIDDENDFPMIRVRKPTPDGKAFERILAPEVEGIIEQTVVD